MARVASAEGLRITTIIRTAIRELECFRLRSVEKHETFISYQGVCGAAPACCRTKKATAMTRNRIIDLFKSEIEIPLEKAVYARGQFIGAAGEPITHVLFPGSGLIAVVVDMDDGDQVEAGMVGREGAVGGLAAFGGKGHTNNSICLVRTEGWSVPLMDLMDIIERHPRVGAALLHFEQFLLVQARQTAACNAKHPIEVRLARWLLQACHATGETELEATQESIAGMLGVQRPTISMFANQLKAEGLIDYSRGRINISDLDGLKKKACQCVGALEQQHNHLLGGLFEVAAE